MSSLTSLPAAIRELEEELSLRLPAECLEYLFTHKKRVVLKEGTFIDNEYQDVFLITLGASFDPNALILQVSNPWLLMTHRVICVLQATEVEDAKWEDWKTVEDGMKKTDGIYVPRDLTSVQYVRFPHAMLCFIAPTSWLQLIGFKLLRTDYAGKVL